MLLKQLGCKLAMHRGSIAPTHLLNILGRVAQWVTFLTADTCLTADPGVATLIPTRSHTFMEIDHGIISTAILLPFADSRRVVVCYKPRYVQEVLVNRLVKLAQEKSVVMLTDGPNLTIAVDWDVKNQTKQNTCLIYYGKNFKNLL